MEQILNFQTAVRKALFVAIPKKGIYGFPIAFGEPIRIKVFPQYCSRVFKFLGNPRLGSLVPCVFALEIIHPFLGCRIADKPKFTASAKQSMFSFKHYRKS